MNSVALAPYSTLATPDRAAAREAFNAIVVAAVDLHRDGWQASVDSAVVRAAGSVGVTVWPALAAAIGREVREELHT